MNKKCLQKDAIVMQKSNIDTTDLNGEKAMMDLEKGQYFVLNGVGSRIWDIIARPMPVSDIVCSLMDEYDVDKETCEKNTMLFLGRLNDAELINIM